MNLVPVRCLNHVRPVLINPRCVEALRDADPFDPRLTVIVMVSGETYTAVLPRDQVIRLIDGIVRVPSIEEGPRTKPSLTD